MGQTFSFTPEQRKKITKIIKTDCGIPNLEEIVQEYRDDCASRRPLSEIRDRLRDAQKHARELRRAITALSKGHNAGNEWLLEPVGECEHYAKALLNYKFSDRLKPGRPAHTAEIHLVQKTELIWVQVCNKEAGRGRGPFSKLVGNLFAFSGVKDAPTKHPHEVVAEAIPQGLQLRMVGKNYPFQPIDYKIPMLPPLKRKAEDFFSSVLMVANGSPTIFTTSSKKGGK